MAGATNTLLFRDPITGRNQSEYCFNGVHNDGVDSLCRATKCNCVCHDARARNKRTAKPDDVKLPFSGAGEFIK